MTTAKKITLATVKRAVAILGGRYELRSFGRWQTIYVEAPYRKLWACSGDIHALHIEWLDGDKKYKQESLRDALERIEMGLCDCVDLDCDYCNPEGDE